MGMLSLGFLAGLGSLLLLYRLSGNFILAVTVAVLAGIAVPLCGAMSVQRLICWHCCTVLCEKMITKKSVRQIWGKKLQDRDVVDEIACIEMNNFIRSRNGSL